MQTNVFMKLIAIWFAYKDELMEDQERKIGKNNRQEMLLFDVRSDVYEKFWYFCHFCSIDK